MVVRDYEQEACFVLMFWALAILGFKGISVYRQQRLLDRDLLKLPGGLPVGVEDTAELAKRMDELPEKSREYLLPRALRTAIQRFAATRNVQDSATSLRDVC